MVLPNKVIYFLFPYFKIIKQIYLISLFFINFQWWWCGDNKGGDGGKIVGSVICDSSNTSGNDVGNDDGVVVG